MKNQDINNNFFCVYAMHGFHNDYCEDYFTSLSPKRILWFSLSLFLYKLKVSTVSEELLNCNKNNQWSRKKTRWEREKTRDPKACFKNVKKSWSEWMRWSHWAVFGRRKNLTGKSTYIKNKERFLSITHMRMEGNSMLCHTHNIHYRSWSKREFSVKSTQKISFDAVNDAQTCWRWKRYIFHIWIFL